MAEASGDLGFSYKITSTAEIHISHHGKQATILRKKAASQFGARLSTMNFEQQQAAMARITGQYKHGNERNGKKHSA